MIEIRRYEEGDFDAIWRLHNAALESVGANAGNGPWDDDLRLVPDKYLRVGGEFLVGVSDGEIVAMGALRPLSPFVAEIKRIRVAPALQGRGIGQLFLEKLESHARELGYQVIVLDTSVKQTAAQRLYEDAGYREVQRGPGPGGYETIFYEKRVV
jgi:ribosomal protein S18 acetylase RimI-like enzyme